MEHSVVVEYNDVVNNVRAFNEGLEEGGDLKNKLSYFRAWYYIPELDLIGPGKFIGYKGMTANKYMNSDDLDGKEAIVLLGQHFVDIEEETPEFIYVDQLTRQLLGKYNKKINRVAWFNVPRGWNKDRTSLNLDNSKNIETKAIGEINPIVEVFWRAFLGLYPEDQGALAKRISEYKSQIN